MPNWIEWNEINSFKNIADEIICENDRCENECEIKCNLLEYYRIFLICFLSILQVKEQRLTNIMTSILVGVSLALAQQVLREIPVAVLYGVLLYMGVTSLGTHISLHIYLFIYLSMYLSIYLSMSNYRGIPLKSISQ